MQLQQRERLSSAESQLSRSQLSRSLNSAGLNSIEAKAKPRYRNLLLRQSNLFIHCIEGTLFVWQVCLADLIVCVSACVCVCLCLCLSVCECVLSPKLLFLYSFNFLRLHHMHKMFLLQFPSSWSIYSPYALARAIFRKSIKIATMWVFSSLCFLLFCFCLFAVVFCFFAGVSYSARLPPDTFVRSSDFFEARTERRAQRGSWLLAHSPPVDCTACYYTWALLATSGIRREPCVDFLPDGPGHVTPPRPPPRPPWRMSAAIIKRRSHCWRKD